MHPEQVAIAIVMRVLFEQGTEDLRRERRLPRALASLDAQYPTMTKTGIQNLRWENSSGSFPDKHVIYLTPPSSASAAALWYSWKFDPDHEISICKFYYGVWRMADPHPRPDGLPINKVPSFVGYRFEPPELQGVDHGFYHCQPCLSFGARENRDRFAPDLDDRGPTMPLAANNAVELLLCLYLSLYGVAKLRNFTNKLMELPEVRSHQQLRSGITHVVGLARR